MMGWNRFFVSLLHCLMRPTAVTAQPQRSIALAHIDFTTAQKQTVYQSIAKTQIENVI
jgi:hypothetical protein